MSELVVRDENSRQVATKVLAALNVERPWLITVEPYHARRSTSQNARLWKLHSLASEVTGMSAEDLHEVMLCRFYGYEEKTIGGIVRQIPLERSSTKDKKKFGDFMEATEAFYVSELGVFLG